MPHCVILYTPNVEPLTDMTALCRKLADAMLALVDEAGQPVFPVGGTRVLAYPAAHYAVADGKGEYAFMYINIRIAGGRSAAVKQRAGDALSGVVREHVAPFFDGSLIGITLQIDESPGQVYDARHSSLHPLFSTPSIPAEAGIEGGNTGSPPARG